MTSTSPPSPPAVEVAERPGAEVSEDHVVVLPHAVILLDGATSLRPTSRTGGWYAQRLAARLADALTNQPRGDLAELLADAISGVVTEHDLRPGASPSSTVSVLRWDDEQVDALVLADSPIVLRTTSGMYSVVDNRLAQSRPPSAAAQQHERADDYRDRLRSGGGFDAEHFSALRASADATGRLRNTEDGFWVAEAVPAAAHRAIRARWPRECTRAALVLSDGVSCGVQDYGCYPDWSAMLDHALAEGPNTVLDTVRQAEESDPDGRRWPRPKRHDDQALAVIRFD